MSRGTDYSRRPQGATAFNMSRLHPITWFAVACTLLASLAATQTATSATAAARQDKAPRLADSDMWSGVYTESQAKRGEATANARCASCHGPDFAGDVTAPALVGSDFFEAWRGQPLGALFQRIRTTMPADEPGSMSPQDTADVIARILQLNKFPSSQKEVSTEIDSLNRLKIESAPAK